MDNEQWKGFQDRNPARVFWVLAWLLAVYASIAVVMSNWRRFQSNPTVISLDRNFMEFNTTFMAMTVCFPAMLDKTRADNYIEKKWGSVSHEKKSFYLDFLQTISNVSYEHLENFQKFANDSTIPRDGYYKILQEISPKFPGLLEGSVATPEQTMTDRGICFTVNSALRNDQHDRRNAQHLWDNPEIRDTIQISYEDGFVWFLLAGLDSGARLYPHSPLELSDVTGVSEVAKHMHLIHASYKATELVASPSVAALDIGQHGFKECSIEELLCISKNKESIKFLVDPVTDQPVKSCKCITTCNFVSYTLAKKSEAYWVDGSQFNWQIPRPPHTQLQRNVLYGPADLLVSFGGTVGLFLGCSLLSGAEIIYFFTLRLGFHLARQLQKHRSV